MMPASQPGPRADAGVTTEVLDRWRTHTNPGTCESGHGFMIAPAVGELIAGAVIGEKGQQQLPPFSLARFAQATRAERLVI